MGIIITIKIMVEDRTCQVIMDELDFNPKFGEYIKKSGLDKNGSDYRTVAIIGC